MTKVKIKPQEKIREILGTGRALHNDFACQGERELAPKVTAFPLDQTNDALIALKNDVVDGAGSYCAVGFEIADTVVRCI